MPNLTRKQWYKVITIVLGALGALITIWAVPEPMKSTLTVLIGMAAGIAAIVLGIDTAETKSKVRALENRGRSDDPADY